MSIRFTIEMPRKIMAWESVVLIGSGIMFMAGPMIALVSVIGDSKIPVAVTLLLVLSTLLGISFGCLFIRNEIRRQRSMRAEKHLKSAVKRMGYVALEPIEVHGSGDRILLRDDEEAALWNVSVSRNKVVCEKRT
jgi:hypothetical protein